MPDDRYFATCARGLEPFLANELRALNAKGVEPGRGGVAFAGDRATLYRANLWLRTAVRILQPILEAHVISPDELYDVVRSLDWTRYLTPDHTLAVDCNVRDSHLTHSRYAALRVKDAICDQFVERCGRRPSVDTDTPMVGLNLHVFRDHAVLSLESSGESLHKRGYRPILTRAPINEALGAGLVLASGWKTNTSFADPLCGGGTLAIEAAWLALNRPPGLTRKRFGFMGWLDYDVKLWTGLRDEARAGVAKTLPAPIYAAELRGDVVSMAIDNAKAAGIGHLLRVERRHLREFTPPDGPPGVILCNPPYGERLGEEREHRDLYATLGGVFAERCRGWTACVFTSSPMLADAIGLRPDEEIPLFNGKIPCRLLRFEMK